MGLMVSGSDSVIGNSNIPTGQVTYLVMNSACTMLPTFAALSPLGLLLLTYPSYSLIFLNTPVSSTQSDL